MLRKWWGGLVAGWSRLVSWWRGRSMQERLMMALIVVLLIGVAVRWAWVSSEVASAFRERFAAPAEQTDSLPDE
jgi:hypothetical protein